MTFKIDCSSYYHAARDHLASKKMRLIRRALPKNTTQKQNRHNAQFHIMPTWRLHDTNAKDDIPMVHKKYLGTNGLNLSFLLTRRYKKIIFVVETNKN